VADVAVAFHQDADLAAELFGDFAEVLEQLGGGDFLGRGAAAEGAFERFDERRFEAADVAVDILRDGDFLLVGLLC
jgi:hypothetical protein